MTYTVLARSKMLEEQNFLKKKFSFHWRKISYFSYTYILPLFFSFLFPSFTYIHIHIHTNTYVYVHIYNFYIYVFNFIYIQKTFLETYQSYGFCQAGLNIRKKPFIEFETRDLKIFWNKTIKKTKRNNRYEGKLVSANVINLSRRHLSKVEISLLSKGLKFVSTPKHIKKVR